MRTRTRTRSETKLSPSRRREVSFFPQNISMRLAPQHDDRVPLRWSLLRTRTKYPRAGLLVFLDGGGICIAERLEVTLGPALHHSQGWTWRFV